MAGDRRREIERELAAWRAAERRQDMATPGSWEQRLAADAAARHQARFRKLTEELSAPTFAR